MEGKEEASGSQSKGKLAMMSGDRYEQIKADMDEMVEWLSGQIDDVAHGAAALVAEARRLLTDGDDKE